MSDQLLRRLGRCAMLAVALLAYSARTYLYTCLTHATVRWFLACELLHGITFSLMRCHPHTAIPLQPSNHRHPNLGSANPHLSSATAGYLANVIDLTTIPYRCAHAVGSGGGGQRCRGRLRQERVAGGMAHDRTACGGDIWPAGARPAREIRRPTPPESPTLSLDTPHPPALRGALLSISPWSPTLTYPTLATPSGGTGCGRRPRCPPRRRVYARARRPPHVYDRSVRLRRPARFSCGALAAAALWRPASAA